MRSAACLSSTFFYASFSRSSGVVECVDGGIHTVKNPSALNSIENDSKDSYGGRGRRAGHYNSGDLAQLVRAYA